MEAIWISDRLAFSEQPATRDLKRLRELGVRTIVNVRMPREQINGEEEQARRAGLHYVRIPTPSVLDIREEHLLRLDEVLRDGSLPVLVHSAEGARAGVLALTWHAVDRGWTVDQLELRARSLGLELPTAARTFVRNRSLTNLRGDAL